MDCCALTRVVNYSIVGFLTARRGRAGNAIPQGRNRGNALAALGAAEASLTSKPADYADESCEVGVPFVPGRRLALL
jgi:hypothetical protein